MNKTSNDEKIKRFTHNLKYEETFQRDEMRFLPTYGDNDQY